jgi:opacity protein-like surface antigen
MRFIAVCLLALSAPAYAQSPASAGPYIDINGGRTSVSSRYADDSNDLNFGVGVGYQFSRALGVEVYTRNLSMNPFRGLLSEAGYYPDRYNGVAVMGAAPLDAHFSVTGRLGVGRTTLKSNRSDMSDQHETDPAIGIGVRYEFNRMVSAELEAIRLTKSDATLVAAGVRFQF